MNLTNGYHPLWAVLLGGAAFVVRDRETLLRFSASMSLLFYFGAIVALWDALRRIVAAPTVALATGVFVALVVPASWYVTEAPFAVCLFAIYLRALLLQEEQGRVAIGVLGGLAVLARLDAAFLVVPMLVAKAGQRPRALMPALFGLGLPITPYLTINLICYGHLMPISGALKSSFPWPTLTICLWGAAGHVSRLRSCSPRSG